MKGRRHDPFMRMPWSKSTPERLDLLHGLTAESNTPLLNAESDPGRLGPVETRRVRPGDPFVAHAIEGLPLMLPVDLLHEDADNPRTEFPEADLDELAENVRQHGILQAIVVHPADATGHYRIHFGAKRWRAARRVGLLEVPVVVRDAPADAYTQVAENQKRHGLTPLDLARFIRRKEDEGDSNATVAKRLGMNLTTVAHHLALLDLPPELDEALKSGRCTSPRTLHELSQLHAEHPEQVRSLVAGDADITRAMVSAMRAERTDAAADVRGTSSTVKRFAQANAACARLEQALERIDFLASDGIAQPELVALRARITDLASRWSQGSDRQTP